MLKTNSDRLGNRTPSETSAPYAIPAANSAGKLSSGWGGAVSGLATLDGSSLVVQNPANATATPTASKIPIADGSGLLDGWITTPVTPIFTKEYVSSEQTITSAGALTLAHSLGAEPKLIQVWIICKTAEQGYSIGDKIVVPMNADNGANSLGVTVVSDSTNLNCRYTSNNPCWLIAHKTTGGRAGITNANWKAIFKAWA